MPNANVNKVTLSNGATLIDLTGDTVTSASHIVAGYVGHLADGSQVTGTAPKKHTATVTARTNSGGYVRYIGSTGTQYGTVGDTFEFNPGEELYAIGMDSRGSAGKIIIDGVTVASGGQDSVSYTYTLPDHDISISFSAGTTSIEEASSVSLQSKSVSYTPSETAQTATVTADSGYDGLSDVSVSVGAIPGTYVGSQVPTQAAQTIHPSTSAQTIASGKYLTGTQTVEAVTTNITADKIVSGFTAKIGSVTDDDCVASILGTASGGGTYGTKTITANGTYAAEDDGYDGYSEVTVNVPSSGWTADDLATNAQPSGAIVLSDDITTIGNYAFAGKPITSITAPKVTSVGEYALYNTRVTSISDGSFPSLGVASQYMVLLKLTSVTHIHLTGQRLTLSSGSGALRGNTALVEARLPYAASNVGASSQSLGSACFYGDTKLELVDAGFVRSMGQQAFYNCNKIQTLILRYTSAVVSISNMNAFQNTPFRGYNNLTGTVYVPSALISSYQTATNWATMYNAGTCNFVAIEGSEYELE